MTFSFPDVSKIKIRVPSDVVRTREQILEGHKVYKMTAGDDCVFFTCSNCGGSGDYPSSMIPPGRCRFYCWNNRTPDTYGKMPVSVEKYVKRQMAADRSDYRAAIRADFLAPYIAENARRDKATAEARAWAEELERAESEAYEMDRLRVSDFVGKIGERLMLNVMCVGVMKISDGGYGTFGPRYLMRMRDESGNVLTQWTGSPNLAVGDRAKIKATVKEHSEYRGERQTVVQRVTEVVAK